MNHLITMIRIEVIAPADVDRAVHELISSAGATGYTSVAGSPASGTPVRTTVRTASTTRTPSG